MASSRNGGGASLAPTGDLASETVSPQEIEESREPTAPEADREPEHKLSRSVTFQCPERRPSGRMAADTRESRSFERDRAESSADEQTGILGAHQGRNRDYQTAGSPGNGSQPVATEGTGVVHTIRKRKGKKRDQTASSNHEDKSRTWWAELAEKYGSVELENKGSVARDHLALERTFLAWLRTSLSFASIGIAVTQLFRLNTTIGPGGDQNLDDLKHVGKPLGATFIAIAIVILFIGFHRYFESQHYIIREKFPASRGSIFLVSLIAGALIVSSLVVILAIARGSFD